MDKSAFFSTFPLDSLNEASNMKANILAAFEKCGICYFNPQEVYSGIPKGQAGESDSLFNYLQAC